MGSALASVVGVSTHPLSDKAKVLSAEMTGFMSGRHEMSAGLRYTQELKPTRILDVTASGGQDSRAFSLGMGVDFEAIAEDVNRPRVSFKPFFQQQRFEAERFNLVGFAPTIRKGLTLQGNEIFPYLALPAGFKIDGGTEELSYHASLTFGASMPFPGAGNDRLFLNVEGNRNMGASSDYLGCLVSWIWN